MTILLTIGFGYCDAVSLALDPFGGRSILDDALNVSRIGGVRSVTIRTSFDDEWRWVRAPDAPHVHDRYCALLGCAAVDHHEPERTWPAVTGGR